MEVESERDRERKKEEDREGERANRPQVPGIKKGKHEATRNDGRLEVVSHPALLLRVFLS
jgi:hypothetical protein